MKKLMLLVLLTLGGVKSIGLYGQKMEDYNLFGKAESPTNLSSPSNQRLKSVAKFNLADQALADLVQKRPASIRMSLPRSTGEMVLELHKVQLADSEFKMFEAGKDLAKPLEMGVFYQGKVAGDPNSLVAISCFKDQVTGNILSENKAYVIGQKNKSIGGLYTLEEETPNGVLDGLGDFTCATQDVITPALAKEMAKTNPNQTVAPLGAVNKVVNIHFECDFDMYVKLGSNPQALLNYVTSMFNLVHAMYRNESIVTRIKSVKYWTSTDPYASKTNTLDALTEFGNQMRAGVPNGANVAHLLSTRSLGGGIAWLDMVCVTPFFSAGNNSYAGPFAVSAINTTFSQLPTYSWTIEVVTHEMGHTLGSPHTQNCNWTGGALDNCYTTEGGCAPGPAPVNGGTIMSYCHLTSYGINFNNGFGTQPGNLIRNRVAAQTCLNTVADAAITVSTNTLNLSNAGGNATVNITTTPTDLFWAVSDNASWVNLSLASGKGAASLVITADANSSANSRGATVTIAGENAIQTISIIQPANNGNVLSVSPETASAPNTSGSLPLVLTSNVSWAITSNAGWLTTNFTSGSNNGNINANYTANPGAARSGVITITGGGITKTVIVTQAAASTLNVSPDLQSVSNTAGGFVFALTSNVSWTITSNATWLTTNVSSGSNNASVTTNYTANTGVARTGILTISGGGITKTVTVNQSAVSSLVVTPTVQPALNTAGSFGIAVFANVSWTITSNATWLTTNSTAGANDGTITASYDANTGVARSGVLTFAGGGITKTVTVNQDAVSASTLTVSPEVQTAPNTAGSFSITVVSNANWTVSSNAVWLTVNTASGSSNGLVNANYSANTGVARTGVLTFSGGGITKTVTVNQDAANASILIVSPETQAAPNTAGSFSITVTSNTSWQITSNAAWLTVNSSSGSNNATILASYSTNAGDARSGILTFTGGGITRTVTVNQSAVNAMSVSPTIQIAGNTAGSFSITLTSNINWSVTSNAVWLSATPTTGSNNGTVTGSYSTNPGGVRTGVLTFTGGGISKTVTVNQEAANALVVTPEVQAVPNTAGSFTVVLTSTVSWTVSSNAVWLTNNQTSGSNNASPLVSYTANTGTARTGILTFTGGGITKTVTVNQAAANALTISPDLQVVPNTAGSFTVTLTSNVNWTVNSNAVWLTINQTSGSNNASPLVSYAANTGAARSGILTFTGGGITKTLTVNQTAVSTLEVTPNTQAAPNTEGSFSISIASNVNWTISSNAVWLTTSTSTGSNNGTISAKYIANTGIARTGVLTFTGGGITKTVTVNQAAANVLDITPTIQAVSNVAGSFSITLTANVSWTVSSNALWLTTNPTSGNNSAAISANYTTNNGAARSGTLTFTGGGITKTVTVNQAAANALTASPDLQNVPNTAGSFTISVTSNISWIVTSNVGWLTVSINSGSNNASVIANYTANTGDGRTGIITFSGGGLTKTVTVNQTAVNFLTVSPATQSVPSTAGTQIIAVASNVNWSVSSNVNWLSSNPTSGSNSANVTASYAANTGAARTGVLTFTGGGITKTVIINQAVSPACTSATAAQLSTSNVTTNQATLICGITTGASTYAWRYRLVGSTTWISIASTTTNSQIVTGLNAATNYEFQNRLFCTSSAAWTTWSTAVSFKTASNSVPSCEIPTTAQLSASNITATGARLSCAAANTNGFNWRYRIVGISNWNTTTSTTSFLEVGSLTANRNYEFQVQKNCGSNSLSAWSSSAIFSTLTTASTCATPTIGQISASNITATSARLNTTVTGASAFNWQYKMAGAANWTTMPATTAGFVDMLGLNSASNFEFQVQINCGSNNLSNWSPSGAFSTVAAPCNPSTAQQLSATNVTATSARLNTSLSGAVGFNWQYRVVESSTWTAGTTSVSGFSDISGLSASTNYEYQVQTKCSGDQLSTWSASGVFNTLLPPCPAPVANQLSVTNITATSARFNTSLTGVVGYVWRYHKIGDAKWINPAATTTNTVTISGFAPGTNYEFQVQVNCVANNPSAWSVGSSFTTLAALPAFGGFIVAPIEPSVQVLAYPNPTTGLAVLQIMGGTGEMGQLEVVDLQGRVVYKKELIVLGAQTEQVDISTEPNGVYILRLISSKILITSRLIKE